MTYRDSLGALRARRDHLRTELRRLQLEGSDAFSSVETCTRELATIADRIRALDPGARVLLARMRVASRCDLEWGQVPSGARVSQCAVCEQRVYDVRELTSDEVDELLARNEATPVSALHRRLDGGVMTADCPRRARHRAVRVAWAVGIALVAGVVSMMSGSAESRHEREARSRPVAARRAPTPSIEISEPAGAEIHMPATRPWLHMAPIVTRPPDPLSAVPFALDPIFAVSCFGPLPRTPSPSLPRLPSFVTVEQLRRESELP